LTHPSREPNQIAEPTGGRTRIPEAADAETARSLHAENAAADDLARAGYRVEQNPTVPGTRNPDLRVEGNVFDVYSPNYGTSLRNIFGTVVGKVTSGQTQRVVLNLNASGARVPDLVREFAGRRGELPGLREVLGIRRGHVSRIYP
jgi:hypothetical protein